jgi:8-oxo-dGTP pyrophosphatase MutT (NUDIX family)
MRCAVDFWRGLIPTVCANIYRATDFCPFSSSRLQRRQCMVSNGLSWQTICTWARPVRYEYWLWRDIRRKYVERFWRKPFRLEGLREAFERSRTKLCSIQRRMPWCTLFAMSAGAGNVRESRLAVVTVPVGTDQGSDEFVRLSQLRKLRECEQVAAVCYRLGKGGIEFLLVRTRGRGRWTFPKGGAEPGLTHAQAAALEAFEEAGVHGRIEETPFARYVRRKRSGVRKSSERSCEREFVINAHLCQVLRLGPSQEAKRDRTWFSVEDAKQRLRKGRKREDGVEFVRVVERAVTRIERLHGGVDTVENRGPSDWQLAEPPRGAAGKDPLQKVQFEAGEAPLVPYIRRRLGIVSQPCRPANSHREVLPCEVIQFSPSRVLNRFSGVRKLKALGTGTKNG